MRLSGRSANIFRFVRFTLFALGTWLENQNVFWTQQRALIHSVIRIGHQSSRMMWEEM